MVHCGVREAAFSACVACSQVSGGLGPAWRCAGHSSKKEVLFITIPQPVAVDHVKKPNHRQ